MCDNTCKVLPSQEHIQALLPGVLLGASQVGIQCTVADLSCPVFSSLLPRGQTDTHGFKAFNMQKQVLAKSYIVGIKYLDKLVPCGPSSQVLKKDFVFFGQAGYSKGSKVIS